MEASKSDIMAAILFGEIIGLGIVPRRLWQ